MEAHDRVLLQALQDFVVPLIRTVDQTIQISTHPSIISEFKGSENWVDQILMKYPWDPKRGSLLLHYMNLFQA
jgi:hypothetical protein